MENYLELEVKSRLDWSLKQWEQEKSNDSGLKRLVNSIKYWHGRLRNAMCENNVILTMFKGVARAYPSLQRIANKLSILNDNINIIGYAKFKNKRFLSLTFENAETRNYIANNLVEIDDCKIAYLHWASEMPRHIITVDWLALETDLDLTIEYVDQFMEISSVKRETTLLENGKECTSGRVCFKGEIKNNINIDYVPHLAKINELECLITVEGRPIKCFVCDRIGHRAVQCLKRFCKNCKAIKMKIHDCLPLNLTQTIVQSQTDDYATSEMGIKSNLLLLEDKTREKVHTLSPNLFLYNKLVLTDGLAGVHGALNVVNTLLATGSGENGGPMGITRNAALNGWFKSDFGFHNSENLNKHITEQSFVGDSNFVLLDTSTNESSSDTSCEGQFIEKTQDSIIQMAHSGNIARSLVDDTSSLINAFAEKKKIINNEIDKASLACKRSKSDIQNSPTEEIVGTQWKGSDSEKSVVIKNVGCRKKKKKKLRKKK